jgi:hypothetical protein
VLFSVASKYRRIEKCRIAGTPNLVSVLNLGHQSLTGVFPKVRGASITEGPLELVWSPDSGLLQLAHSFDVDEMYGDNYGYRSSLNQSMVRHLTQKVRALEKFAAIAPGDAVLDIGSNDATLLKAYTVPGLQRFGIDPSGLKFRHYYPSDIALVPDFFSAKSFRGVTQRQAKLVTSIAMFYDLENPIGFAQEVADILANNGIWHFEQSYMPSMLRNTSYDTICHEHLEYYSLSVVQKILDAAGLKLVDVEMNAINGGSFAVTAVHNDSPIRGNQRVIDGHLEQEIRDGLDTPSPFMDFEQRVFRHRQELLRLLKSLAADGKKVLGYGASTKGNVVLQFCGLRESDIPAIAEVNADKFGAFTPGSNIPIVSENEARAMQPDYFLVLPWHFRESIIAREQAFLAQGGHLIFPFPEIEIV